MGLLFGMAIGGYLGLYLLAFIPGAVEFLSNKPNRYRPKPEREDITTHEYPPSTFGFFTKVKPGQEKLIQRGGTFMRAILAYPEHMHKGERSDNTLSPRKAAYWEIVKTEPPFADSHPIPFPITSWEELIDRPQWLLYSPISILWWIWKLWVYKRTGYIFTGIPPFQTVRVYPMERFHRVTDKNGTVELVRREDYSDHYRVADFQYPAKIAEADTRDNIPVDVLLNMIAQVFNSYLAAYDTDDDWPTRFLGSVSNRVTMFTRPRPLDEVWTAKSSSTVNELSDFVTAGGKHLTDEEKLLEGTLLEGSTSAFGIRITQTQVLDISPTNKEYEVKLGVEAFAKVQRKADEELAKGKAAYVREEGEALKAHPYADIVVHTEGMVRAAEAAGKGGGIVILGGGQSFDPASAAILKELRELRKDTKGTAP